MADRPFNVAVCQAGACRARDTGLLGRLAAVVRRCPQGVLIRTGCLLHAPRCRAGAAHDSGAYLLVQPCDAERRPRGAAIPVGPVLDASDVHAVAAWLAEGDLEIGRLDRRLTRPAFR